MTTTRSATVLFLLCSIIWSIFSLTVWPLDVIFDSKQTFSEKSLSSPLPIRKEGQRNKNFVRDGTYVDQESTSTLSEKAWPKPLTIRKGGQGNKTFGRDTTVVQQEATPFLAKKLKEFGVKEYIVFRNRQHSQSNDSLPLVMLVHHREMYAGCHSFERFVNPKWRTVFVLEDHIVDDFKLLELGRLADSPGVHIATLNSTTRSGEWLGRQVALLLMEQIYGLRAPLLLSAQCDIHPLPYWHKYHIPFETIVQRMVNAFTKEDLLNQRSKDTSVTDFFHHFDGPRMGTECGNSFSVKQRPLFAMNTILLETFPSSDDLLGSKFHGPLVGFKGGWKNHSKRVIGESNATWISDVSSTVEDHLVLYNTTLLAEIVNPIAQVHSTIAAGVSAIAQNLCQKGWKAIRLDDVHLFYDIAKPQLTSSGAGGQFNIFDPTKYGSALTTSFYSHNMQYLAEVAGPMGCFREYMRLRLFLNFDLASWCGFAYAHFQRNHVPATFWTGRIHENSQIMFNIMKMWGYELADTTTDNYMFVSVPTNHTAFVDTLFKSLQEGTIVSGDRIQVGRIPAGDGFDFHYISMPLKSQVTPDAFFEGLLMKKKLQRTVDIYERPLDFKATSLNLCSWVADDSQDWDAALPLTRAQVLRSLAPLANDCEKYMQKFESGTSPTVFVRTKLTSS